MTWELKVHCPSDLGTALLSAHFHQSASVTSFIGNDTNMLRGIILYLCSKFKRGLKIFSKPCCKQMVCHPGFVIPFIEQGRTELV